MYTTDRAKRLSFIAGMAMSNWPSRKPLEMVCLALILRIRLLCFIQMSLAFGAALWKMRIHNSYMFIQDGIEKACPAIQLGQYHMQRQWLVRHPPMTMDWSLALKAAVACLAMSAGAVCASANELASEWSEGKRGNKARLVAGAVAGKPMAAIEIVLGEGWKTYWRVPGDAGGVPPAFNWSKSANLEKAEVLYPAPTRFSDKDGDALGFKGSAIFPVALTPKDAAKPMGLVLTMEYGICREICIPVEIELKVEVPPGEAGALSPAVIAALERVPRLASVRRPTDPKLIKTEVTLDGAHPSIAIEADFPGGTADAGVYVESVNGVFIPLAKRGSAKEVGPNQLRFEIDLTGAVDPADIRGKDGKITLVSAQGLTEATFKFE
jgi:DsbC/DsbD-like thiol-disulfide interchange protein